MIWFLIGIGVGIVGYVGYVIFRKFHPKKEKTNNNIDDIEN